MNKQIKVEQLKHANQFVITKGDCIYLQSYKSIVAKFNNKSQVLTLGKHWCYSNTTLRHLYFFIEEYCYAYNMNLVFARNKKQAIKNMIAKGIIEYRKEIN